MNPASSITTTSVVARRRARRRPASAPRVGARRWRASSPASSRASSAASVRWRWITSQTYSSVNATMPSNSVNSISPSSLTSPSGRNTLASWWRLRHSSTLKCTSGISSTASRASTPLRLARCSWRAAEAAHGEVADVRDEEERRGGEPGVPLPEHAPREPAPQHPTTSVMPMNSTPTSALAPARRSHAERVLARRTGRSPTPRR